MGSVSKWKAFSMEEEVKITKRIENVDSQSAVCREFSHEIYSWDYLEKSQRGNLSLQKKSERDQEVAKC
ncbi:hypothetical protein AVEN_249855-1, partial [Araneus ventricosus]